MISSEYAAGIVDGEGTITIVYHKNPAQAQIKVSVEMAAIEPIYALQKKYGGNVCVNKGKKETHNDMYRWAVSSVLAAEAIKDFKDFLLVKKIQAETALAFQETVGLGHYRLPTEVLDERVVLMNFMKDLNRIGKEILL